jgi:hypothetical protein
MIVIGSSVNVGEIPNRPSRTQKVRRSPTFKSLTYSILLFIVTLPPTPIWNAIVLIGMLASSETWT